MTIEVIKSTIREMDIRRKSDIELKWSKENPEKMQIILEERFDGHMED